MCSNWLAACPVHSLTPASVVSLICEAIPELRCYYSCRCISGKLCGNDCPQSQEAVSLSVPEVQTELSREASRFSVTSAQKSELNECEMNALLLAGKRILKGSSGSFIMNLIQSAFSWRKWWSLIISASDSYGIILNSKTKRESNTSTGKAINNASHVHSCSWPAGGSSYGCKKGSDWLYWGFTGYNVSVLVIRGNALRLGYLTATLACPQTQSHQARGVPLRLPLLMQIRPPKNKM